LVVIVLMYVLQFCGAREDASIFTTGLAALYAQYLQWTALSAEPDKECNPNTGAGAATAQILLGILVTWFALFMMSGTAPTGEEKPKGGAAVDNEEKMSLSANETKENADETKVKKRADGDDSDEEHDKKKKAFIFAISKETIIFQLIMMLSAMYYAMLCTNWLQPGLYTRGSNTASQEKQIYWLKVVSLWISLLIYVYSMVAPMLFPDRQF